MLLHYVPENWCKFAPYPHTDFEILLNCVPDKLKYSKKFPAFSLVFTESHFTLLQVSKKLTSPLDVLWKSFSLVFFAVSCISCTEIIFQEHLGPWSLDIFQTTILLLAKCSAPVGVGRSLYACYNCFGCCSGLFESCLYKYSLLNYLV